MPVADGSDYGKGYYLPTNSEDGEYIFDVQIAKQRYQGGTGCTTEANAKAYVDAYRARKPKDRVLADAANMTWMQGASKYMTDKGSATKTADMIRVRFHLLTFRIGPNTKLQDIDDELLGELIKLRKQDHRWEDSDKGNVSGAMVNRSVTDLVKRVLTHARKRYKVPLPNEPDYVEFAEAEEMRVRVLSDYEEALLRNDKRKDLLEFVDFLLLSGLRLSAALIQWKQVDFREGVIRVPRLKRKKNSKNPLIQEIPITPRLEVLLRAQVNRHETFVFTYQATKTQRIARTDRKMIKGQRYPLTSEGFSSSWEDLCWRRGVDDLRIHDLRKTAGTRMLRATGNIAVVSEFLGHCDIRMTMRFYAFMFTDDVRAAMMATETRYYEGMQMPLDPTASPPQDGGCTCGAGRPTFRPPGGLSPVPYHPNVAAGAS
ncbi:tyrosine-type recombinase/integrase [Methylobacterium sp. E-045]|uniref:tyrosine-type recombinase/integrase n=1 Tax=Methylobacterium sp. E-045 TaxID=2836575 RepID=UPI001FBC040D|nr:site-specific integrase [Methylobacterium sp. E-045]MCJ2130980.1 site-specific integrase [Methylobacterium sp. E-045]